MKTISLSAAVKKLVNGCFVQIPKLQKKLVKPCFVKIPKLLFQSYNYDQWCHAVRVKPKFSKEDKQNVDLCIHLLDTLPDSGQGYGEYVENAIPSVPDITDYYTITRLGRIVNKPYRYRCEPFPVKNKSVKRLPRRQRSILCN